ncbi:dTDP-4-dehydrorhamnose 3,5-epimerase [Shimia sp.]|uniref:dTDP-4-dehydrorhamnose 3,5-epimerase n=1 Tax=Shimia sp. TaxID=1954381 RepID=UPI003299E4E5
MKIETTKLSGLVILTPLRFGDARGFFSESWNRQRMTEIGIDLDFVQDNHSLSMTPGTVRGLHFQAPPHAQDKLVRCGRGALLDVAVDIRAGSPTYKQWFATELSAENGRQLLIPIGFAHGFVTLTEDTEIIYKCTDYYAPHCDRAIAHDDPDIAIDWDVSRTKRTLSEKDMAAPTLAELGTPFTWEACT